MGLLFFIQLFSNAWYIFVYYAPISISYGYCIGITFVLGVVFLSRNLYRYRFMISKSLMNIILIDIFIVAIFLMIPSLYGYTADLYKSYRMVLLIQTIPISLCAYYVGKDEKIQDRIQRITPIIGILFTGIAFISCVYPTSSTGGGYAINDYGLDYNSASYLAALASGLLEYAFIVQQIDRTKKRISNWIIKAICALGVFINLYSILIAGGRGGLVAYVVSFLLSTHLIIKHYKLNIISMVKFSVVAIGGLLLIQFIVNKVINSSISTSGFSRILSTLSTGESGGRDVLRSDAFASFKTSMIIGHGFGSVFYEIGYYSHNIFTDALVETGILGLMLLLGLLISTAIRLIKLIQFNETDCIWMFIFLYSLSQSMFSGYYLAQIPLYWVIVFSIAKKHGDRRLIQL